MSLCALFSPNSNAAAFKAGYVSDFHPEMDAVSNDVCCGADVSVPGQQIAFYMAGLVSGESHTPLTYPYPYSAQNLAGSAPKELSRTFVQCNLGASSGIGCMYRAVPGTLPARAEASLIYVPYGQSGLLILIGGTTQPADLKLNTTRMISNFLNVVWIYDIGTQEWYNQTTSVTPGQELPTEIASFCNVVVETSDGKNHHIYIYGGYDGTAETPTASDQVWVLVIPSFRWVLASQGTSQHRRQNHKCVLLAPTQMMSIGGMLEDGGAPEDSIIDVLGLNDLKWTKSSNTYGNGSYLVPDPIAMAVGGTRYGGAELPDHINPAVAQLFTKVPGFAPDQVFYPYCGTSNSTTGGNPLSLARRLGLPDWMGAVLAIFFSLVVSFWGILALIALRRRAYIRAASVDTSIIASKNFVVRWMHNASPAGEKGKQKPTVIQRDSFTPLKLAYVDEEEAPGSTNAGKSTSSSIRTYERSFLDENGEVELRTFVGGYHTRTP